MRVSEACLWPFMLQKSCALESNPKSLSETEIWVRMPGNREKLEGEVKGS